MKYFYTLVLITAISFNLLAQNNFKPGYVVTLKGDTTKGFIDYKDWNENPFTVGFKPVLDAATQQYTPVDIKAFAVNGFDSYRSYNVKISQNDVETSRLLVGIDTTYKNNTVFLRILTTGRNVTLYDFTDNLKHRYFIEEKTTIPVELGRFVFLDTIDVSKIRTVNTFRRQLLKLAITYQPNEKKLVENTQLVAYNLNDLKKIVVAINGGEDIEKLESERSATMFFIGAAANITRVYFTGNNSYTAAGSSISVLPQLNAGFDFPFNKNVGTLVFRTEVSLSANQAKFFTHPKESQPGDYGSHFSYNQYTVSVSPQIIYNVYNNSKVRAYLAAGLSVNISSYNNRISYIYFNNNIGTSQNTINTEPHTMLPLFMNVNARTGISTGKFDFFIAYSPPTTTTNYLAFEMKFSSFRSGINYFLSKK